VNRSGDEVAGHPVHRSLRELPGPVDLVVVAVPAAAVPAVAHDAVAIGAGAMVVISSGFAETGPEGRALEADLLHIARTGGLRVLGPNCLGLAVTDPERPFDATFGPERPPPGRMAFASQSGGLGIGVLAFCRARGIGLSAFASLGNKADLSSNDLLGYWSHDERTRVILLYLEGFGNPRRFARLARSVARRTPIVALKGGRSPAGLRAAGSHTAALAAGEGPTDALFRLAGVVRVDTVEDLFETGQVLADQPLPRGPRVAIVSNAGGPAILAADTAADLGLEIPAFDDALVARIRAALPSVAAPGNPVDLGAGAAASAYAATIGAIAEAGAADAIIAIHTPTRGDWHAVLRAVQAQSTGRIPIVGCLLGRTAPDAEGASRPVPWLGFPESAAKALARAVDAGRFARRVPDPPHPIEVDRAAARAALAAAAPGAWLDPARVEQILRAYGIPTARSEVVSSAAAAAAAQSRIGRPVAVKLRSSVIIHKSDVGGVVLGCETPASARAAYREIAERVGGLGEGAMEGALVQEQAPGGLDVIVGAVADPVFGPLVVAGMGGVQAELWGDRALALAPIGPDTAARMWSDLRGAPLIAGYRGGPAADREALVDILQRVALLAHEQPLLGEMDLNPVRALAPGAGALTLDARIRRAEA
jgi:acyl-CoA synthetase (NDP forming)